MESFFSDFLGVILHILGIPSFVREIYADKKITIVNYHNPAPDVFEKHIKFLIKNYSIIHINQLVKTLKTKNFTILPPKPLLITIDDGYITNFQLLPILKKYKVPIVLYVTAGLVDTNRMLWFNLVSHRSAKMMQLKNMPDEKRRLILELEYGHSDEKEYDCAEVLSKEHLFEFMKAGNVIGSHTMFHPLLNKCLPIVGYNECYASRKRLNALLGISIEHFAYPDNSVNTETRKWVIQAGYTTARSIKCGFVHQNSDIYSLPCFGISDNANLVKLELQTTGLWDIAKKCLFSGYTGTICFRPIHKSKCRHKRAFNVLLNTPNLMRHGGVSFLYKILRIKFLSSVHYFEIDKKGHKDWSVVNICRIFRDYARFYNRLKTGGYQLVHLNPSLRPKAMLRDLGFFVISIVMRRKVVISYHGWDERFKENMRKYWLWFFKIILKADACIVLGNKFCQGLRDMGYKNPIFVINGAIDTEEYKQYCLPILQKKVQIKEYNLLFLARIEKYKGIYEALESYKIIKKKIDNVRLFIVGDGSDLENAKSYVKNCGLEGVVFTGYLEGIAKYKILASSYCYILPTYGEGMPLTILEAMAAGLPIIVTNVGAIPEVVENGINGIILNSPSPNLFANAVIRLIQNPELARGMSEKNRVKAMEYDVSVVAKKLMGIYEYVISYR